MLLTDCETFNSVHVLLLIAREYRVIHKLWTYFQTMISYVFTIKKYNLKLCWILKV